MKTFSVATVGGVLGKDPESKALPSGAKVVSFSIAVEKGFGDRKSTSWFNILTFDKAAEFSEKYLRKGKPVIVTGDLQIRSWDDRETGAKRYSTEITAYKVDFGESGGTSSGGDKPARQERSAPAPRTQQVAPARSTAPVEAEISDDDLPF